MGKSLMIAYNGYFNFMSSMPSIMVNKDENEIWRHTKQSNVNVSFIHWSRVKCFKSKLMWMLLFSNTHVSQNTHTVFYSTVWETKSDVNRWGNYKLPITHIFKKFPSISFSGYFPTQPNQQFCQLTCVPKNHVYFEI